MTTWHETTIDTVHATDITRIASLRVTEGEPDGQTIDWSLGPITAISRRPRPGDKDLYEIWPTHLHTIIRIPAGTPVRFTLLPNTPQLPPPATPQPVPPTPPTAPTQAPPRTPAPWLAQPHQADQRTYPPPTGQPHPGT
ncbi:hypothetical protein [Streptomyces chartreusis]|uniref:hypothetical protein n=1 Tax=Streptomyces chartreusis TaxID=1969 RepID=UPI002F9106B0|nr:hypothetical protein OG938_44230 [Streptomyces chartreusis]WSZ73436.1 hypothetical protein OG938_47565 [Streptomyces chartreusis]WTA33696.1 hypothetical protein OIA45_48145 [Streptomyces chartreusis]